MIQANGGPKSYEELEFTDDFMFAQIMRNNPEICRKLLELILGMEIEKVSFPADTGND